MSRTLVVTLVLLATQFLPVNTLFSQCIIAPPPDPCTGTEPTTSDNDIVANGTSKWFYGSPTVFNTLTIRGGKLVVCGDLTVTNFTMDSGTLVIRPGARFQFGGGAGVALRGNSAIYNYGRLDIYSVLSLEGNWASPAKPNVIVNANINSVMYMSNFLVINNPNSFFVNNGHMECWGIVTDNNSAAGSVCVGNRSHTEMSVLVNNIKNPYTAPNGAACIRVRQSSSFRDTLTNTPDINVCIGNTHTSGGTRPNAWGTPSLFNFCSSCSTLVLLNIAITDFALSPLTGGYRLSWKTSTAPRQAIFILERSTDGAVFYPVDSIATGGANTATQFAARDINPPAGTVYYRVKYRQDATGKSAYTGILKTVYAAGEGGVTVSPNPFVGRLQVSWPAEKRPQAVYLTNISGVLYYSRKINPADGVKLAISLPAGIQPGEYFVKLVYKDEVIVKRILKSQNAL